MTLTIRLKRQWITSVLRQAGKSQPHLPWHRGHRSRPLDFRDLDSPKRPTLVRS